MLNAWQETIQKTTITTNFVLFYTPYIFSCLWIFINSKSDAKRCSISWTSTRDAYVESSKLFQFICLIIPVILPHLHHSNKYQNVKIIFDLPFVGRFSACVIAWEALASDRSIDNLLNDHSFYSKVYTNNLYIEWTWNKSKFCWIRRRAQRFMTWSNSPLYHLLFIITSQYSRFLCYFVYLYLHIIAASIYYCIGKRSRSPKIFQYSQGWLPQYYILLSL